MTQYGGGTGTPTGGTPVAGSPGNYASAISLADYAALIGYRDCAFWGVRHPDNDTYECREVWTLAERNAIMDALIQAQDMLEAELRYPLTPRYITGERHVWADPILADWGYVIEGGVISDTVLLAGAVVNYALDPAVVTVNVGTCAAADIHVFHAGTATEIEPTSVVVAAGVATITIPWCRLVDPDNADNPREGWDYNDTTIYATTVDVHCITTDTGTQAHLIVAPGCLTAPCTDTQHDACIYVRQPVIGSMEIHRADYSGGAWSRVCLCYMPSWVEINYVAGLTTLSAGAKQAIIRLAHSLLPNAPCGCETSRALWRRDMNVPTILTRERINAGFGMSDGAWWSWQWAQNNKLRRGSVL